MVLAVSIALRAPAPLNLGVSEGQLSQAGNFRLESPAEINSDFGRFFPPTIAFAASGPAAA